MKNILRVWKRDVLRLFKAPAAMVVIGALILLPSLYTWFNVVGFWDPYNNTGGLRVCVVNEDVGASNELTGDLDVGAQIVSEIEGNTQLGWTFTDRETAMEEVHTGKAYAAFIIPEDFSHDITTLVTGDIVQPKLEYYVNEKSGAVSPKITDTGASTLDQTVNSTFISTVSSIVADSIDTSLQESQEKMDDSQSKVNQQFGKVNSGLEDARTSLAELGQSADGALAKTAEAKQRLLCVRSQVESAGNQLDGIVCLGKRTQDDVLAYAARIPSVLDNGSILIGQSVTKAQESLGSAAGVVKNAKGQVDAAIKQGQGVIDQNQSVIDSLKEVSAALKRDGLDHTLIDKQIADLESKNRELADALAQVETAAQNTSNASDTIAGLGGSITSGVEGTMKNVDGYRTTLSQSTLPTINAGVTQLNGAASTLAATVSDQKLIIDQAIMIMDQLSSTLQSSKDSLSSTDGLLVGLQNDLTTLQSDLTSLSQSTSLTDVLGETQIDADKVASFMLSPTKLTTEKLYPLKAYGSAMAPLFTNLTLWIGVFMLMVILKQEVDSEGIEGLTVNQSYIARWLFLAPLCAAQAAVCIAGNLFIGVQAESIPLLFLTAIFASLTYLSIQFALSVTLQHIGKGICIIMVFIQIPGATGLYPVEMVPDFFRTLYPFFPFTYGINAMRETIAGFYDGHWAVMMGVLLLFGVMAFLLGLLAKPYLANINRLFAKEVRESDILNGEEVQAPARRYRVGQLIQILSDRDEYRERLHAHEQRFQKWYPNLKHGVWAVGICVPVVVSSILILLNVEKVIILTCWLVWLCLVMLFLTVVEHIRDNYERQLALRDYSDDDIRGLFGDRSRIESTPAGSEEVYDA